MSKVYFKIASVIIAVVALSVLLGLILTTAFQNGHFPEKTADKTASVVSEKSDTKLSDKDNTDIFYESEKSAASKTEKS